MPPKPAPGRASGRSPRSAPRKSRSSGPGNTILAFLLGAAATGGAAYLYLHTTPPAPPSRTSAPAPAAPLNRTPPPPPVPRSPTPAPPFGTSEDVFEAGAHLYAARCASCHGTPRKDVAGKLPSTQLWRAGRHAVSDPPPGTLFEQISLGTPEKGMPAYARSLTPTQIWQLALLLKNADQDLPDPVLAILNGHR